ncbi:unnamed protein product [Diplocarpon coronariae]
MPLSLPGLHSKVFGVSQSIARRSTASLPLSDAPLSPGNPRPQPNLSSITLQEQAAAIDAESKYQKSPQTRASRLDSRDHPWVPGAAKRIFFSWRLPRAWPGEFKFDSSPAQPSPGNHIQVPQMRALTLSSLSVWTPSHSSPSSPSPSHLRPKRHTGVPASRRATKAQEREQEATAKQQESRALAGRIRAVRASTPPQCDERGKCASRVVSREPHETRGEVVG